MTNTFRNNQLRETDIKIKKSKTYTLEELLPQINDIIHTSPDTQISMNNNKDSGIENNCMTNIFTINYSPSGFGDIEETPRSLIINRINKVQKKKSNCECNYKCNKKILTVIKNICSILLMIVIFLFFDKGSKFIINKLFNN